MISISIDFWNSLSSVENYTGKIIDSEVWHNISFKVQCIVTDSMKGLRMKSKKDTEKEEEKETSTYTRKEGSQEYRKRIRTGEDEILKSKMKERKKKKNDRKRIYCPERHAQRKFTWRLLRTTQRISDKSCQIVDTPTRQYGLVELSVTRKSMGQVSTLEIHPVRGWGLGLSTSVPTSYVKRFQFLNTWYLTKNFPSVCGLKILKRGYGRNYELWFVTVFSVFGL